MEGIIQLAIPFKTQIFLHPFLPGSVAELPFVHCEERFSATKAGATAPALNRNPLTVPSFRRDEAI